MTMKNPNASSCRARPIFMIVYPRFWVDMSFETASVPPNTWIRKEITSKTGVINRGGTQRLLALQKDFGVTWRTTRPYICRG
jgi:hypothetical protein